MADPSPLWAQGHELAALSEFAQIFASQHKALVFGQFGLVRERDIAEALTHKRLAWTPGRDAAAVARITTRPSTITDFAGREMIVPGDCLRIDAIAGTNPASLVVLMQGIRRRAGDRPVLVEIFEEDATAKEAMRHERLAYWGTRIGAGSELKGYYSADIVHVADQRSSIDREAEYRSLAIIDGRFCDFAELEAARTELAGIDGWAQHYSSYNKRRSWTAMALRGYDPADPSFIIKPAEMAKSWQVANPARMTARPDWTPFADRIPAILGIAKRALGGRQADRVRLMRLSGGGELSRHADVTDHEAGVANGRLSRLHIPLITNKGVVIEAWDKRGIHIEQRWPAGALCYLDQRGPHRVTNADPAAERIHLVIDAHSDAALRKMIVRGKPG